MPISFPGLLQPFLESIGTCLSGFSLRSSSQVLIQRTGENEEYDNNYKQDEDPFVEEESGIG